MTTTRLHPFRVPLAAAIAPNANIKVAGSVWIVCGDSELPTTGQHGTGYRGRLLENGKEFEMWVMKTPEYLIRCRFEISLNVPSYPLYQKRSKKSLIPNSIKEDGNAFLCEEYGQILLKFSEKTVIHSIRGLMMGRTYSVRQGCLIQFRLWQPLLREVTLQGFFCIYDTTGFQIDRNN